VTGARCNGRFIMTTEDDFQRRLDEHPDDFQTRLVFADWLQERGDRRAEGYRALGVNRLYPDTDVVGWVWRDFNDFLAETTHPLLPDDWAVRVNYRTSYADSWANRRDAEDAAAIVFADLPPKRRAELLAAPSGG
jgi:uncharacterized protein (TIGR02996 family)